MCCCVPAECFLAVAVEVCAFERQRIVLSWQVAATSTQQSGRPLLPNNPQEKHISTSHVIHRHRKVEGLSKELRLQRRGVASRLQSCPTFSEQIPPGVAASEHSSGNWDKETVSPTSCLTPNRGSKPRVEPRRQNSVCVQLPEATLGRMGVVSRTRRRERRSQDRSGRPP